MKLLSSIRLTFPQHTLIKATKKGVLKNILGLPISDVDIEKSYLFPGRLVVSDVIIDSEGAQMVLGKKNPRTLFW